MKNKNSGVQMNLINPNSDDKEIIKSSLLIT
jgi:hypothetical protein